MGTVKRRTRHRFPSMLRLNSLEPGGPHDTIFSDEAPVDVIDAHPKLQLCTGEGTKAKAPPVGMAVVFAAQRSPGCRQPFFLVDPEGAIMTTQLRHLERCCPTRCCLQSRRKCISCLSGRVTTTHWHTSSLTGGRLAFELLVEICLECDVRRIVPIAPLGEGTTEPSFPRYLPDARFNRTINGCEDEV